MTAGQESENTKLSVMVVTDGQIVYRLQILIFVAYVADVRMYDYIEINATLSVRVLPLC